jgi:hypothetical protein
MRPKGAIGIEKDSLYPIPQKNIQRNFFESLY